MEPIERGAFIIEYTGKKIPNEEAEETETRYIFEIDDDWSIDGSGRDNIARYINHSCRPNCEVFIEGGHICVYARRNIKAGEELGYHYGLAYVKEFIAPNCRCGFCDGNGLRRR